VNGNDFLINLDETPQNPNHSIMIVILGFFSLLGCGPLGAIAIGLAVYDLVQIRKGAMSGAKKGLLVTGIVLGALGIAITVALVFYGSVFLKRSLYHWDDIFVSKPLKAEDYAFAGDWEGNLGTVILIDRNGRGSVKTENMSIKGGQVTIEGDKLEIGFLGFKKTFHIDQRPVLKQNKWEMIVDGETFSRAAHELQARHDSSACKNPLFSRTTTLPLRGTSLRFPLSA
jgi:hypothetical protein